MANNQYISILDYLRCNTGFSDRKFIIIREKYQEQCGGSFPEEQDESAIREVARQLKIQIDTDESWSLLCDCVVTPNMEESMNLAKTKWKDELKVPSMQSNTSKENFQNR